MNISYLLELIRTKKHFTFHAPRQTGKTSALLALRNLLTSGSAGPYRCLYVNLEAAQAAEEDVRGEALDSERIRVARSINPPRRIGSLTGTSMKTLRLRPYMAAVVAPDASPHQATGAEAASAVVTLACALDQSRLYSFSERRLASTSAVISRATSSDSPHEHPLNQRLIAVR